MNITLECGMEFNAVEASDSSPVMTVNLKSVMLRTGCGTSGPGMKDSSSNKCPRLFTEILDMIVDDLASHLIDHFPGDLSEPQAIMPTLYSCALTSRHMRTRVNQHLFKEIEIKDYKFTLQGFRPSGKVDLQLLIARIKGLVAIMDANPAIKTHIQSFVLSFFAMNATHLNHEENCDGFVKLQDALMTLLPKLPATLQKFSFVNLYGQFDLRRFQQEVLAAIMAFVASPSLESLSFSNIAEFPLSALSHPINLKRIRLHVTSLPTTEEVPVGSVQFPFQLTELNAFNSPKIVEHFVRAGPSGPLSTLEELLTDLVYDANILLAWDIMCGSAQTLRSIEASLINDALYSTIYPDLIDLSLLPSLRFIKLAYMIGSREGERIGVPASIIKILTSPRGQPNTLKTIHLRLNWECVTTSSYPYVFHPLHGWAELDAALIDTRAFPALKEVVLNLDLGFLWLEPDLTDEHKETLKAAVQPYVDAILPSLRRSAVIQLNIDLKVYKGFHSPH
ncbi:unnamed protein product [Cyclocybe aegerita]|uniref:Uncharacterized protein n=1 Tax=Cyclocybe aegerita TaxID=1973307 RepID=A0A8S0VRN8_CYCAE|nr:unnamed protein product [Cyclocybe aegerita]